MNVPLNKLKMYTESSKKVVSLEGALSNRHDDTRMLGDKIAWDGLTPEEHTVADELRADLGRVMEELDSRERQVVRMRFGLDNGDFRTHDGEEQRGAKRRAERAFAGRCRSQYVCISAVMHGLLFLLPSLAARFESASVSNVIKRTPLLRLASLVAEVAKEVGVSRERVRLIEAKALNKLRHPSRNFRLREYFLALLN